MRGAILERRNVENRTKRLSYYTERAQLQTEQI